MLALLDTYLFTFFVSVSLSLLCLKYKKFLFKIYSQYNAIQKIHEGYVPPIGGFIMFLAFYLSILFYQESFFANQIHIFAGSILILLIGLLEDFSGKIKPIYRLITIFIASLIFVTCQKSLPKIEVPILEIILNNIPFAEELFYALGLTILANGMNMVDGMNGLAGMTSLSIILAISSILTLYGGIEIYFSELSLLIIVLIVFLLFNFPFGKIFLGDSGAYWIGWILGVWIIEIYAKLPLNTWGALLILFYPIYEVIFSFTRKILSGKSPFQPDTNHLHIKLYFFLKADNERSIKFNSFVTVCLMPFWIIPSVMIVWTYFYSHLTILFIVIMILTYNFYYKSIPNKD